MRALLVLCLLSSSLARAQDVVEQEDVVDPQDAIEQEDVVEAQGAPEGAPEDVVDPADQAPPLPKLELEGCRQLVRQRDLPAARVCYEQGSPNDTAAEQRVRQRVGGTLAELTPADEGASPFGQLGELVTSGKAELIAGSTVFGAYLGTLAVLDAAFLLFQMAELQVPSAFEPALVSTLFLAPIAGGTAGLVLSTLAYALWPQMSAGDANLLRASLWLATFNSGVSGILTNVYGPRWFLDWWRYTGFATTTGMIAVSVGTVGAAVGLALATDLPEGAGPLALSLGTGSAALAVLGQLMFDLPLNFEHGTLLVTGVANLGFGAGLFASPFVPITRFETWLLDLGAVAGTLLGTAIVLGVPAPNPVLGYGGIATGLVLGAATGVAIGKLVPLGLELVELPTLVAVAPLLLPPGRSQQIPLGAQVSVDIDAALGHVLPGRRR